MLFKQVIIKMFTLKRANFLTHPITYSFQHTSRIAKCLTPIATHIRHFTQNSLTERTDNTSDVKLKIPDDLEESLIFPKYKKFMKEDPHTSSDPVVYKAYSHHVNAKFFNSTYSPVKKPHIGVLLVNLGSPDAPKYWSVMKFLREFLSDRRIISIPAPIWYAQLYLFILPFGTRSFVAHFKRIWPENKPHIFVKKMGLLAEKVQDYMNKEMLNSNQIEVQMCMRYNKPALKTKLQYLLQRGYRNVLVLPLYPQAAEATVSPVYDEVFRTLKDIPHMPNLRLMSGYCDHPLYIEKIKNSILSFWEKNGKGDHLFIAFHGIPASRLLVGEPYYCFCRKTYRLIAEALNLKMGEKISLVFQSRFGKEVWLQPYFSDELDNWSKRKVDAVIDVVSPGFSVDCVETVEEIELDYAEEFEKLTDGKGKLRYIYCLNDDKDGIELTSQLIFENIGDWLKTESTAPSENTNKITAN